MNFPWNSKTCPLWFAACGILYGWFQRGLSKVSNSAFLSTSWDMLRPHFLKSGKGNQNSSGCECPLPSLSGPHRYPLRCTEWFHINQLGFMGQGGADTSGEGITTWGNQRRLIQQTYTYLPNITNNYIMQHIFIAIGRYLHNCTNIAGFFRILASMTIIIEHNQPTMNPYQPWWINHPAIHQTANPFWNVGFPSQPYVCLSMVSQGMGMIMLNSDVRCVSNLDHLQVFSHALVNHIPTSNR